MNSIAKRLCLALVAVLCSAIGLAIPAHAQNDSPFSPLSGRSRYTSPPASVSINIDGKEIKIDYYAPSMHGRKVMGGLVPYGEVWCTGANWSTQITTDADLDINGLKVPKGSYSLWTLPTENDWTLIVNKEPHVFHLNYPRGQDFGRVKMNLQKIPNTVETFKIELSSTGNNKGKLALMWENTEASVPFTVLR